MKIIDKRSMGRQLLSSYILYIIAIHVHNQVEHVLLQCHMHACTLIKYP